MERTPAAAQPRPLMTRMGKRSLTGKKHDLETGLDYFGARHYSNGLGRWVSADWSPTPIPVRYADFSDPQSLNLYSYARNVPTTHFDVDGHFTDYYSTSGTKLGSDGVNNGAVAVTPFGVDKTSDGKWPIHAKMSSVKLGPSMPTC